MKKLLLTLTVAAISLVAADYSQMTMEQLQALRGTVAVEDRDAFRAEMQKRMQAMTPQERQAYKAERGDLDRLQLKDGSGDGRLNQGSERTGDMIRQRLQDGSGAGSMSQGAFKGGKN